MNTEAKNLAHILSNKVSRGLVAPFYIIKAKNESDVSVFISELKALISPLEDHPDLLDVDLNKDENTYKVESQAIKKFLQFLNYRPLKLSKKIIFFHHADKINDTLSNKFLKTLEELPEHFLLFFFVNKMEDLLPTIQSRAIKLNINETQTEKANLNDSLHNSLDYINAIRSEKDKSEEHELIKQFLTHQINEILNEQKYKKAELLLASLKQFEQSQEYNNTLLSRLSFFSES